MTSSKKNSSCRKLCQFILKWSRQMTKFTSDKQGHQTKQKQERKQKLDLLS
jgi:hypothetical protein